MAYSAEANPLEEWVDKWVDLNTVAEDKLSAFVNCSVQDSTFSPNTTNRAKKSLPKKLTLKPTNATHNSTEVGVWAQKHIPKGTRFGPIVGEIKPVKGDSDSSNFFMVGDVKIVTADVNKTFIWNVFSKAASQVPTVIDVGDILKSNWMRYVQFAENKDGQNLVAYQDGSDIFFLVIRDIQKDEELAVWFCKEFAARVDKPERPLEWRESRAAANNVEISIKISDKQSEEGLSVRDNESDSGYTGSPICDQNESDENSYSENKHEGSKSCNGNSTSENLLDSEKKSHGQASGETSSEVIHLQRDLNVEITPGSKFIKLRGKSFFQSIFYCLLCKSGTGLFMGEGDLVHHFQVTCKTCAITFHGFQDFHEHMISNHEKISSNRLHQLFKEWSEDFIEEIYGHAVDTKASEVDTKASDADTNKQTTIETHYIATYAKASAADTKASDVDTKGSDVDTKASDVDTKASDVDTKASDVDTKAADVDTKASNVDTEASYVYTKESGVSAKESVVNMLIAIERMERCERGELYCKLNIAKEATDEKIDLVENVNLDDSQANNKNYLLKHRKMNEEVERNLDEVVNRKSDMIMHNIKMHHYRQEIDSLQQSHMDKDNMIKGKVEELMKYCQLSSIDCPNVNTVYEQAIEALQECETEKDTLFTKLDSIQKGVSGHSMDTNVENGNSGQDQINEKGALNKAAEAMRGEDEASKEEVRPNLANMTEEIKGVSVCGEIKKERKRDKAAKPYCARASCPNKGRHRCSRCKAVFYCHEDCLTEDWPHHKTFCDYVYEANKCPHDSSKKDPPETEDSGGRDEVD